MTGHWDEAATSQNWSNTILIRRKAESTTSLNYTSTFQQLGKHDIARAGGKGANLGEMTSAGLPVPTGFVLTTDAYAVFIQRHGLQQQIVDTAAHAQTADLPALEKAADTIRRLILDAAIPDDVIEALQRAYAALPVDAVAVRSSATAEDLLTASFAGQQDTYLNVRGVEALLEAVKQCWASLWTARAMTYRARQGIEPAAVAMGVVVQTMVAAEIAGILFTANPASGARDELVVNASFGLGEAVVSGAVSPDTYLVDRGSLNPKKIQPGTKEVMIVAGTQEGNGENTIKQPVPKTQQGETALDERLLSELAALGLRVEELFGSPQDIEWAVADDYIWLLQSRPITNLPPAPLREVRWEPPIPQTVWMRRQVVEHMPEPLSPLFAELYLQEGLTQSFKEIMHFMGDLQDIGRIVQEFLPGPFAMTINGYAYTIASFNFRWRQLPEILHIYVKAVPTLIRRGIRHWRDEGLPGYRQKIAYWKEIELAEATDVELLHGVRELAIADAVYWFSAAIPLGLARITDAMLESFLKSDVPERDGAGNALLPSSGPYLRGFPSKAVEAQVEVETIAAQIRQSEALHAQVVAATPTGLLDILAEHPQGAPIVDALQRYLDRYGHQIYNLDFATPTQVDDPRPVLLSLVAAVQNPERDARAHQKKLAQDREALIARTEQALGPIQYRIFRLLLGWAQRFAPYREEAIFYVGAAWPTLRRLALELGRRLSESGTLNDPDDVFYLHSAELKVAAHARDRGMARVGLGRLARARRTLREARQRLAPPISVPSNATLQFGPFRFAMFEPQPSQVSEGATLQGFAVSPGQVTARASVIRSPQDFDKMVPDTILVCPTTTPAWTPLFSQATALVTDIGGALAHGSIVAREYGIPAVMGTGVATQRIRHGQRVQVDGDSGTVTLFDETNVEASADAETANNAASNAETDAANDVAAETHSARVGAPSKQNANQPKKLLFILGAAGVALFFWWQKRRRRRRQ